MSFVAKLTAANVAAIGGAMQLLGIRPGNLLQPFTQLFSRQQVAPTPAQQDAVALSRMSSLVQAAGFDATAGTGAIDMEALNARQQELLAALDQQLGTIFRDVGVNPQDTVALELGAGGAIRVASDGPRAFALEAALSNQPETAMRMQQLEAVTRLMQGERAAMMYGSGGAPEASALLQTEAAAAMRGAFQLLISNGASQARLV